MDLRSIVVANGVGIFILLMLLYVSRSKLLRHRIGLVLLATAALEQGFHDFVHLDGSSLKIKLIAVLSIFYTRTAFLSREQVFPICKTALLFL